MPSNIWSDHDKEYATRTLSELASDLQKPSRYGQKIPLSHWEGPVPIIDDGLGGRLPTDPDEVLGMYVAGALSVFRSDVSINTVPDLPNKIRTLDFYRSLGFRVESISQSEDELRPGVIYVASQGYVHPTEDSSAGHSGKAQSLDTGEGLTDVRNVLARTKGKGTHQIVCGPPLGFSEEFLQPDVDTDVTIMGQAALVYKKDKHGSIVKELGQTSTNTCNPLSRGYITEAVKKGARCIPSSKMTGMTIHLTALKHGTDLIKEGHKSMWSDMTVGQLHGRAPAANFKKRSRYGGADELYVDLDEDGTSVVDLSRRRREREGNTIKAFLDEAANAPLRPDKLDESIRGLGDGFQDLLSKDGASIARHNFRNHIKSIPDDPRDREELKDCLDYITHDSKMDDAHVLTAWTALNLAFKSIYDEKTLGGHKNASRPGRQCSASTFKESYARDGVQVPYDGLAQVWEYITDEGGEAEMSPAEKEEEAKKKAMKIMLMTWMDLPGRMTRS